MIRTLCDQRHLEHRCGLAFGHWPPWFALPYSDIVPFCPLIPPPRASEGDQTVMGVGGFAVPWLCIRDANLGQNREAKLPRQNPLFLGGTLRVIRQWSSYLTSSPVAGGDSGRVLANNAHERSLGPIITGQSGLLGCCQILAPLGGRETGNSREGTPNGKCPSPGGLCRPLPYKQGGRSGRSPAQFKHISQRRKRNQ